LNNQKNQYKFGASIIRNYIKKFLQLLLYGNLYIGLLAGSIAWANSLIFEFFNFQIIIFIFFSTTLIYNLDRLFSFSSDYVNSPKRSQYVNHNFILIIFIISSCITGILFFLKFFNFIFIITLVILFLLTILYLLIFNKEFEFIQKFLRISDKSISSQSISISILKPILLALVWAFATIILPVFHNGYKFSNGVFILLLIRFIEYGVNGVLFDYRDTAGDYKNKKNNLFLAIKPKSIFLFAVLFLLLNSVIICFAVYTHLLPSVLFFDFIVILVYIFLIWNILHNKIFIYKLKSGLDSSLLYPLIVDGVYFLPAIFTILVYSAS